MSKIRAKPHSRNSATAPGSVAAERPPDGDVLTLAEAAAYLRVSEQDLLKLVRQADFPGRLIGSQWRFLKAGLQDWLRASAPRSSNAGLLALAGAWKGDPDLEAIVREAYRRRGRPITEAGLSPHVAFSAQE